MTCPRCGRSVHGGHCPPAPVDGTIVAPPKPSDLSLEQHRRAVRRLCRDVDAVDSVAAVLVEAERRMVEARFLLSSAPKSVFLLSDRPNQAVAVLEAGIAEVRAALGTGEAES